VTRLPDWLVERAALDEVAPASRARIERADPRELAERMAELRDDNAAELARHPAGPAVAQIEERIAAERRAVRRRRRRRLGWLGIAASAAAAVVALRLVAVRGGPAGGPGDDESLRGDTKGEGTRVKGSPRLLAFRQVGQQVERLPQDALVHAGDVIQLRYNAAGHGFGVIASVDGAGVVTLHFPLSEQAPPQATAVSTETATLPDAYALDDAPGFERFFFVTANDPVDVRQTLAAVRELAHRDDCATAKLELPAGLHQWSLRLRKPDGSPTNESP
jgi:hypothetical protein